MERASLLLVHGEASVREGLQSRLKEMGYTVHPAEDGAGAREVFREQDPNLVLLATHLPDGSSRRLITEFMAQKEDTPIILWAKSDEIDEAVGYLALGVYDVVEMPARPEWLDHKLQQALECSRPKGGQAAAGEEPVAVAGRPGTGSGALAALARGFPSEGVSLAEVEKELIEQALRTTHWNKSKAARLLRITRDTLRYKVKKYHLESPPHVPSIQEVDLAS